MNGDYQFQNPNEHDPNQGWRLALVMVLMLLIIVVSQPLLKKLSPPPPPKQEQPAPTPAPAPQTPPAAPPVAVKVPAGQMVAAAERDIVVENDLFKLTFTNRGAQVKSWILKRYKDDKGQPLELINKLAAEKYGYPLSLFTYDDALNKKLDSALFVVNASAPCAPGTMCSQLTRTPNAVEPAPIQLSFVWSDGDVFVRKVFGFDKTYVLSVETSVTRAGQNVPAFPAWHGGFGDQTVPASYSAARIDYLFDDSVERIAPKSVHGGETLKNKMHWGGPVDQYFAALFLPSNPESIALVSFKGDIQIPKNLDKPDPKDQVDVPVVGAAVGDPTGPTHERLFVGPKAVDVLESIHATNKDGSPGPDLEKTVDFGKWFGFIAKPLFIWLKWTEEHWISNWGWAIVFLTIIINVALLPLRISSMKSALKMQKVAPQMKAIQEKYKKYKMNDPRKADMNKEMQELYQREGVNPVGGCFPMLIQFPFIVAFYSMLGNAIELRHAPWLWVRDLSAPDPYYVLPILIVASMFVMQRMTPQAGMDPTQQKMMNLMMPIMLGYISWFLAAGLSVYYVTSNLVGMAQQLIMNQTQLGREIREAQLKRARKQAKR